GPGGNGTCGNNCDAFCVVALAVCPQDFADMEACSAACTQLPTDCGPYHVVQGVTPDTNSIQCRIYHVDSATLDAETHCPHVKGDGLCPPTSPSCTLSSPDGGDGG